MDQQARQKYMALAVLVNGRNLNRAQFCATLRRISSIDDLLFVLDRITDATALRRGLNVFVHHKDFTLRALFVILPKTHYFDHGDLLGDALLRHKDFSQNNLCAFLEKASAEVVTHVLCHLAQDQRHQPLLINLFQSHLCNGYGQEIAAAIVCHPIPVEQLHELITETVIMDTKLIFAVAAAQIEDLAVDVLRSFFRTIEGAELREVTFIDATHISAGETFLILLTETEFEGTRKACLQKLEQCPLSIATIEYWLRCAEQRGQSDAVNWFNLLLSRRYAHLSTPQLLDILIDLNNGDQRYMINSILAGRTDQLRAIANIEQ
ncbi:TPA: hypothetical protein DDZ49_02645 [Candidatus Wolfebacteria bacterium]|nr:hypothetical protein [Candidatus Wolfebacteria bacterium]HAS95721.1 hypothetical protein [Candidatus Wolfebacteria bacterium]HBD18185.1 hypothetical protein [Candidatus Wolfebacteria bacterium]HBN87039.1 hypothetical protein [Candidatus Wolfebacteria bacterium]HBT74846.1 hypothetical protein [Candidatus Wolfebacteria bacterium]